MSVIQKAPFIGAWGIVHLNVLIVPLQGNHKCKIASYGLIVDNDPVLLMRVASEPDRNLTEKMLPCRSACQMLPGSWAFQLFNK